MYKGFHTKVWEIGGLLMIFVVYAGILRFALNDIRVVDWGFHPNNNMFRGILKRVRNDCIYLGLVTLNYGFCTLPNKTIKYCFVRGADRVKRGNAEVTPKKWTTVLRSKTKWMTWRRETIIQDSFRVSIISLQGFFGRYTPSEWH